MCNCRKNAPCPLEGQCLKRNLVYRAVVQCENSEESYVGLTSSEFKTRYNAHNHTFRDSSKRLSTELSKHVWSIKDQNKDFSIKWSILGHARPYDNISKKCNLCILEKYYIICQSDLASLNKRNEIVNKCRHQNKYLLCSPNVT